MAESFQEYTVTTALDTYLFVKAYLDQDHIKVYSSDGAAAFTETTNFTLSGTEGNLTVNLLDSRTIGDIVRIRRTTPDTPIVDFQPGTLSSVDLDRMFEQVLYLVQEERDFPGVDYLVDLGDGVPFISEVDGDSTKWDGDGKVMSNILDGTAANHSCTVGQLSSAVAAVVSTTLPAAAALADDLGLAVKSGAWVSQTPTEMRTNLGLGDASTKTVGSDSDAKVPTVGDAKALFAQVVNNLSDLASASVARTNLGLGTAAVADTGTGTGNIPVLDANGLPAVSGKNLDLSENSALAANSWTQFLVPGVLGANVTSGADASFGATACRVKLDSASGKSFSYNVDSADLDANYNTSSTDAYTVSLKAGANVAHEVHVGASFSTYNNTSGLGRLSVRTTTTMSGATGWTVMDEVQSLGSYPSDLGGSIDTTFIVVGDALIDVILESFDSPYDVEFLQGCITVRRLT